MAKKNANGEGSRPRKRPDGRWEGRYWSRGSGAAFTVIRARRLQTNLADALDDGVGVFVSSNITVAEFLAQYEDAVKHTMKRRSIRDLPEHRKGTSSARIRGHQAQRSETGAGPTYVLAQA